MGAAPGTFGGRLRHLRQAAGLTQSELAHLVGVTLVTVSRWETDKQSVSLDHAKDCARALGASPEWLVLGSGSSQPVAEAAQ